MRFLSKAVFGVLASVLLASCGGGGGGGNDSAFQPQGIRVTVTPASTASTPSSLVGVTVRVTGDNGAALPDGTAVRVQVSPPGVGLLSTVQAGGTFPPNQGGTAVLNESVTASLAGGLANFRLHTRAVGTATITASVTDPNAPQRNVTGAATVGVAAGAPTDQRLTIQTTATTLPVNPIGINYASPYFADVTITWRNLDGTLVTPRSDSDFVGASISPVSVGVFTTLDNPETRDINERLIALGQGPLNVVAGRSIISVFSRNTPGTATLTVSAVDQITGETVSAVQEFRVVNGVAAVPGAVVFISDTSPFYIQGINAISSKPIEIAVFDGAGALVPNAAPGVNNLRVELQSQLNGGERLIGVNAAGNPVQGASIVTRTINGQANLALQAGTVAGSVILRATADRADNNVDNGITDPVVSTRQFTISDGRLFDLQIQTANFDPVSSQVAGPPSGSANPDATYQFLVTALATDRFGNPVPAGAEIRFGLIDEPQAAGEFLIRGNDGNPQENGIGFVALGGAFTTAGGGVGPGDTLVVFAEDIPGNRDMEAARTVAAVQSPSQLTVTQPFNPNDVSGTSVDAGPIYPYVIGRAADANVRASGLTDSAGVAASVVTYPARRLGKRIILWAQGNGALITGGRPRIVSDVESFNLAGAGPGVLTVAPGGITANRTTPVRVCLRDASGNPVPNANIDFAFSNAATGSVNGVPRAGRTPATASDGCVTVNVLANLAPGAIGAATLLFTSSGAEAEVTITAVGTRTLAIGPSPVPAFAGAPGQLANIAVCINDGGGPIPSVIVAGTCTAPTPNTTPTNPGVVILNVPQTTTQDGCAVITATYSAMIVQLTPTTIEPRTSTCTITTNIGLTGTVQVVGTRRCGDGLTPVPVGCPP